MSELDELKARVDALEAALRGVDRDQPDNGSAIRATHHLVQALAITQGQHTTWLEELRTGLAEVRTGNARIIELLNRLIERRD
jgi:truncated hemoglobin YjbI